MRYLAALALSATAFASQAQTLDVSVIHGIEQPIRYSFALSDQREQIDLRESHNYQVAFRDPATKKDVCREGVYQTGLLLTLRPISKPSDDSVPVEIVGQVSSLNDLRPDGALACGANFKPEITNAPFSDTVQVSKRKNRVVIIDNTYTVIVSLR